MGLGDKAAAFALTEQAMVAVGTKKDAVFGPIPIEILARVAAQMRRWENPIGLLLLCGNFCRYLVMVRWQARHLLLHCSVSIPCSTRCAAIPLSKNSVRKSSHEDTNYTNRHEF
jgi:hypothetical protein